MTDTKAAQRRQFIVIKVCFLNNYSWSLFKLQIVLLKCILEMPYPYKVFLKKEISEKVLKSILEKIKI